MKPGTQTTNTQSDRDQFVRDNAVALVSEYEALVLRLRKRIRALEESQAALRRQIELLSRRTER